MNKLKKTVMILIFSLTACVASSLAQDKPSLSAQDLQTIRQITAERDYYKQKYEEEERAHNETKKDRDEWQKSAGDWKKTAEDEKFRADVTQGNRIKQLENSSAEFAAANFQLREQHTADRQKIGEQNAEIIRLKSSRKWYFAAGFATGFAAGGYGGYQVGKRYGVSFRF